MADYIADYSTVNTSAAPLPGREGKVYAAAIQDSIAANATIKFGRGFQRKAGVGEALAVGDIAAINTAQAFRVAMYSTNASDLDNANYSQYDMITAGKSGFYVVEVEETVTIADAVRVRLVNHASDPVKLIGKFGKTADEDKTALIKGAHWVSANIVFLPDSIELILDNLS